MTKFSNKSKKNYFGGIFGPFPQFLGQKLKKKSSSIMHNNTWVPKTMPSFRKN